MTDQLIGKTIPVLEQGWIELVDMLPHPSTGVSGDLAIVNAARVSFLGESKGTDKDKKLLFYLLRNRHTSPFEMVEFKFRLRCPLVTWWQLVRHRTLNLNLQCLSGDTLVTFDEPDRRAIGSFAAYRISLRDLYRKWQDPFKRSRVAQMKLRVLNEETMLFESKKVSNVWHTGKKHAFKIKTSDGYEIVSSEDHRFLFENGWSTLKDAIGLSIINGRAVWKTLPRLYVNGKPLDTAHLYTDADWLRYQYHTQGHSLAEIAQLAGCTTHTIRKYLQIHKLTLPERRDAAQFKKGLQPWNKGLHYSFNFTDEQREKWAEKTRQRWAKLPKSEHPWWKGGISKEREKIGAWTTAIASQIYARDHYQCAVCGEGSKQGDRFHAHHIIPVWADPDLTHAYDRDNLITLHKSCHKMLHAHSLELEFAQKLNSDITFDITLKEKYIDKRAKKRKLAPKLTDIVLVEYLGEIDMYDITVDGEYHNFVADGFIVHNSGRYTPFEENDFYAPSVWRKQSASNKQASEGEVESEAGEQLTKKLLDHYDQSYKLYEEALKTGVSKELARLFLPGFSVYYTGVIKSDAHNLMHFLKLRMAQDAQYEIRVYAQAIYEHFFKPALPWTAEAFEQYVLNTDK
jgi:thymidylate synthase (FAD)